MTDRDENGRFTNGNQAAKGNKGGPGRPPKAREERFLEITLSKVTYKDWAEIVERAVTQAKRGDATARKFLADYLLGPPTQKHDIISDNVLRVEYVNDWRDQATEPA